MNNLALSIEHNGITVRSSDNGEMLNLTDMWKACGSDPKKRPNDWLCAEDGKDVLVTVGEISDVHELDLFHNDDGCTLAARLVALAYAKHLSADFHKKCAEAVLDHMGAKLKFLLARAMELDQSAPKSAAMPHICSCGHSLDGHARFCPECGQRVREAA